MNLSELIDARETEAAKIARARRGLPGVVDPQSIPYGDRPWLSDEDRRIADLLVKAGLTIVSTEPGKEAGVPPCQGVCDPCNGVECPAPAVTDRDD